MGCGTSSYVEELNEKEKNEKKEKKKRLEHVERRKINLSTEKFDKVFSISKIKEPEAQKLQKMRQMNKEERNELEEFSMDNFYELLHDRKKIERNSLRFENEMKFSIDDITPLMNCGINGPLVHVLSFVDVLELLMNFSPVCRLFRDTVFFLIRNNRVHIHNSHHVALFGGLCLRVKGMISEESLLELGCMWTEDEKEQEELFLFILMAEYILTALRYIVEVKKVFSSSKVPKYWIHSIGRLTRRNSPPSPPLENRIGEKDQGESKKPNLIRRYIFEHFGLERMEFQNSLRNLYREYFITEEWNMLFQLIQQDSSIRKSFSVIRDIFGAFFHVKTIGTLDNYSLLLFFISLFYYGGSLNGLKRNCIDYGVSKSLPGKMNKELMMHFLEGELYKNRIFRFDARTLLRSSNEFVEYVAKNYDRNRRLGFLNKKFFQFYDAILKNKSKKAIRFAKKNFTFDERGRSHDLIPIQIDERLIEKEKDDFYFDLINERGVFRYYNVLSEDTDNMEIIKMIIPTYPFKRNYYVHAVRNGFNQLADACIEFGEERFLKKWIFHYRKPTMMEKDKLGTCRKPKLLHVVSCNLKSGRFDAVLQFFERGYIHVIHKSEEVNAIFEYRNMMSAILGEVLKYDDGQNDGASKVSEFIIREVDKEDVQYGEKMMVMNGFLSAIKDCGNDRSVKDPTVIIRKLEDLLSSGYFWKICDEKEEETIIESKSYEFCMFIAKTLFCMITLQLEGCVKLFLETAYSSEINLRINDFYKLLISRHHILEEKFWEFVKKLDLEKVADSTFYRLECDVCVELKKSNNDEDTSENYEYEKISLRFIEKVDWTRLFEKNQDEIMEEAKNVNEIHEKGKQEEEEECEGEDSDDAESQEKNEEFVPTVNLENELLTTSEGERDGLNEWVIDGGYYIQVCKKCSSKC